MFIRHGFGRDEFLKRIAEQKPILSVVVAEFELIEIAVKMLAGHLMERTDQATLEQAERAFNGVCVNVAAHVFAFAVVGFGHGSATCLGVNCCDAR